MILLVTTFDYFRSSLFYSQNLFRFVINFKLVSSSYYLQIHFKELNTFLINLVNINLPLIQHGKLLILLIFKLALNY